MSRHHRRRSPRRGPVLLAAAAVAVLALPVAAQAARSHGPAPRQDHHTATAPASAAAAPASSAAAPASSAAAPAAGSATVSSGGTLTNPMPNMNGLAATLTIPKGSAGSGERLVGPTSWKETTGHDIGAFRVNCDYSHMGFDDPIVKPGQPGASHLHTFFGNTGADASSTATSIATTGNSTCRGGIANRSAYWVPTLFDVRTGQPIAPTWQMTYYKTGYAGVRPEDVEPLPAGLRIVAGDATSTTKQPFMSWGCLEGGGGDAGGGIPTDCATGKEAVTLAVEFPQCWDGKNLDSADHKSHMSYPNPPNGCPASHPVPLPVITINVRYEQATAGEAKFWKLSSDMYDTTSKPAGLSLHGDWMDGWDNDVMTAWINFCNHMRMSCSNALGDGRALN